MGFFNRNSVEACRMLDHPRGIGQRLAAFGERTANRARQSAHSVSQRAEHYARRRPDRALLAALVAGAVAGLLVRRR